MHALLPKPLPTQLANSSAPAVSKEEVDRFRHAAVIQDEQRFRQLLDELIAAKFTPDPARPSTPDERAALLAEKRARPEAQLAEPWKPGAIALQHGRVGVLAEFNLPHNLPLLRYAELAAKSRQQIYKQIKAKKLLALSVGGRGIRIPDWQLEDAPARLTQAVLEQAQDVDPWTLYRVLSDRRERFEGKSPVQLVRHNNVERLARAVLDVLGFQI